MTMVTQELPPTPEGRKRWTRQECEFLENSGALKGRYELIDGEIIDKMGQKQPHAFVIVRVMLYLASIFGGDRIHSQATVEVREQESQTNKPEPDVEVLREETLQTPGGDDILLAVEVSDTTQGYDLGAKVGLYARAGIEEYWVLDINRRVLIAFRRPQGDQWQERTEYLEESQIAPLSAPNSLIRVGDLLPPVQE